MGLHQRRGIANTGHQNLITQIFLCLQHYCKGATWLAALLYWWVLKTSVMLAAHPLISRLENNWAGEAEKEIYLIQDGD
jgi:hypothetical protein